MTILLGVLAIMFAIAVMGSKDEGVRQTSLLAFMATLVAIVWRGGM